MFEQGRRGSVACAGAVLAASLLGSAHAQTGLQLSLGAQYSDGDYDESTNTEALVVPFVARMTSGPWMLSATVPLVSVRGPENVADLLDDDGGAHSNSGSGGSGSSNSGPGSDNSGPGGGGEDEEEGEGAPPVVPPASFPDDHEASGLGDISISAGYSFSSIRNSPLYVDTRARVRFPSGDRIEGLGVGATDWTVLCETGVDLSSGGFYVLGGRRFLGDVEDLERVDGWQAGAGAWLNAGPRVMLGVDYDWRESSTPDGTAPSSLEGYLVWSLDAAWRIEFNAGAGLSSASADYSLGFTLSWRNAAR